jgi:hypothetical protein
MNPYETHIENLFIRLLELRHTSSHLKSVLNASVKNFEKVEDGRFINASALVISDWTGPTSNGWELNYHTGIRKITFKENYSQEVINIFSQECCYAFAQSFEALERFFKDCIFTKIGHDHDYCKALKIENSAEFQRDEIPGGDKLFVWIRKAGGPLFARYSNSNNVNFNFKVLWTILSQVRHAITHSNSIIKLDKISQTDYHLAVFKDLFQLTTVSTETVHLELDYHGLSQLIDYIAEFGFQVFKILSMKENFHWDILKKHDEGKK